ncbi:hypothetical protein FB446DRAFT_337234 [Lentinula raphanica]|nr:hypothetical protein FB446DRAFT_337234 [Lentinula raphanica]
MPPAPGFPLPKVDSRPGSRPGTPTGSRSGTPTGSRPDTPTGSHPGTPVPAVEVDVDVDYEIHIIVKKWRESLMKHGNFRLNYLKSYTDDISENLHDFWFWGDGVGEMCRTQEDFCTFEFTPVEARKDPEEPDLSLGSFTRTSSPFNIWFEKLTIDYSVRDEVLKHREQKLAGSTSAHARRAAD